MQLIEIYKKFTYFCISIACTVNAANLYDQASPLSARLDNWNYPYPTTSFNVSQQNKTLEMIYMDIKPKGVSLGTVLLFHGKNFGSDYWAPTIAALTKAGYRVIAPDQIGFGKSEKPDIDYHFDDLALNTKALLDHLQIKKVFVIANSMGGMLGIRFANLFPQAVQKLVLENPLGLEDYSDFIPSQTNENLLKLEMAQTETSYRNFLKSYFPNWKDDYDRFVEIYVRVQKGSEYLNFSKASVLTYQMIAERPVIKDLPNLSMPTLLIIGQKDRTVFGRRFAPPEAVKSAGNFPLLGKQAAEKIPNAQLVEIDNAGHVPHLEMSDEFNQHVIKFFKNQSKLKLLDI